MLKVTQTVKSAAYKNHINRDLEHHMLALISN